MDPKPQGQAAPEASQGDDAPKYVTEDQLNVALNRAITARFKEFEKGINKSLETVVNTVTSTLDETLSHKLEAVLPKQGEKRTPDPREVEESTAFKTLRRQFEEQQSRLKAVEEERNRERANARDQALRQRVSEALLKGGVEANKVEHCLAYLVDSKKRVKYAEDSDDLEFVDGRDSLDFQTGMKSWLKSDDAKIYMAPRGTNGSGSRPGSANSNSKENAPSLGEQLYSFISNS